MEQDWAGLVRIHPDLAKPRMDLRGDNIGVVAFENSAVAPQQVEHQQIGDRSAIGEAPSFNPAGTTIGDLPAKLGKHARLADAGFANETDSLAVTLFDLAQEIVQNRELALAIDKDCRARRWRFAEPRAAMGNAEQSKSRDGFDLAFEY